VSIRDDQLLNESDLSKILSVSVQCLRKWRYQAKGPPFLRLGSQKKRPVRYPTTGLQAWLASRVAGGEHPEAPG